MGLNDSPLILALPTFLPSFVFLLVVAPALRLLSGLVCYYAATSVEGAAASRGGGKRVRARGKGAKKEDDYDLGGAESLVLAKMNMQLAAQIKHRGELENLVSVVVFALLSLGVAQAAERLLGWPASVMPPLLAFGAVFVSCAMLAKVDMLSSDTSPTNKVLGVVCGILGFSASLALHVLQPGDGRILAWDLKRASAAVGPTIHEVVKAAASKVLQGKGQELEAAAAQLPELAMTDSALQVALSTVAALLAVLLFAPAQRFVRSYFLHIRPPEWSVEYISPRPADTARLTLHFTLPVLATLLWVRPMFQELVQLPEQRLAGVQAGALLLTAAVMASNVRTLLQRYLDRGLTGWHQLKHGTQAARGTKEQKRSLGDLIRMHCQVTNHLMGKAAVQLLGPAVLYLGLGLLLLNSVLHPAPVGSAAAETQAIVQSVVGFLSFWTGACWFVYCALLLWMFRTGVLQP